ncbi:hypothetical protein ACIBL5_14365 [Streptomyces sp. NPDC050516]|uniref:hypothetical protein n=1 Tax=Streptomyces sp. NPDC050516 TaxID=3365621 RepID=UPI0037AF35A2
MSDHSGLYYYGYRNAAAQTEGKWVTVHAGLKSKSTGETHVGLTPASEVNPEDVGTLSLRYADGQPVIVLSGGKYIPAKLEDPHAKFELEAVDWNDPKFSREEGYWHLKGSEGNDLGQAVEPEPIAADHINPAEVARLALTYRDGVPAIVVGVGRYVPTWLPVVDGAGSLVAVYATAAIEPALIPTDQVNPEDIGALSLRYVDGVPQLSVSGGTVIPAGLPVVDGAGNAVAAYTAGTASKLHPRALLSTYDFPGDDTPIIIGSARMALEGNDDNKSGAPIPAGQVSPEDVAMLAIEYRDDQPVIVVSGGKAIPAGLTVVDGWSKSRTKYQMGPIALFEIPRDDSLRQR